MDATNSTKDTFFMEALQRYSSNTEKSATGEWWLMMHVCCLCNMGVKSTNHLFKNCTWSHSIWCLSTPGLRVDASYDMSVEEWIVSNIETLVRRA